MTQLMHRLILHVVKNDEDELVLEFHDTTGKRLRSTNTTWLFNLLSTMFASKETSLAVDDDGNVTLGAHAVLATTVTDGFVYIPTCAGTPTGVPTVVTGLVPVVMDTTGAKLWIYFGGSWKSCAIA